MSKKLALITGASKGIGKALSHQLAAQGYHLLLVARSEERLKDLSKTLGEQYPNLEIAYFVADLSNRADIQNLKNWYDAHNYHLNFLINNAGYGLWGHFKEAELEDQLNMIRLNIEAVVELTYLFIPDLLRAERAYIMNLCSTAAYQAVPTMAVYCATKSFILAFSRSLSLELKKTSVSVTCISPGPTDTDFPKRANMQALAEVAQKLNMTPEEVAKQALAATFKGKKEKVTGLFNQVSVQMTYYTPKNISEAVASNIFDKDN